MIAEYEEYDGLGLARLIADGEVTAAEVLETALQRIAETNPRINAIVTPLYDEARAAVASGLPDGPFRGVPYAFKELVVSVLGAPTTAASRLNAANMPSAESEIVSRCRKAGLVVLGKTNSSEFGLSASTEPALYGITRNPWNLDVTPGGSSGGSAAAVAARILPLAHATDGGGSIRIPASCCGLFGLKPTRARITAGPEGGEGLAGLAHQHAVTRTVRDSAALLDATAGPMPGDPYVAPPLQGSYLGQAGREPGRLRIAFSTVSPVGTPIEPEVAEATRQTAALCEELGHVVVEAAPDYDAGALQAAFWDVFLANLAANVFRVTGGAMPGEGLIEPLSRACAERGAAIAASDYIMRLQLLHREARRIAGFFEAHDIWLTPTLGRLPQPLGFLSTDTDDVDGWRERLMEFIPYTYLFNVTGQPAMSVPLCQSRGGLPIGMHFAARSGEEDPLFALAGQLERARPWIDRRPPI